MATNELNIFGSLNPDTTGRAYLDGYNGYLTNALINPKILVLQDPGASEAHGADGCFIVPQDYSTTPVFIPIWATGATTGNAKIDLDYRTVNGDDSENSDPSTWQESLTVTDAASATAFNQLRPTISATAGNFAAGDTVFFKITREDGSGTDTIAAAIYLLGLVFRYATA